MIYHKLETEDEKIQCAEIMSGSDPWKKLGFSFADCLKSLNDPTSKTITVTEGSTVTGFASIQMNGTLTGYIKRIAIREDMRNKQIGKKLLEYVENKIFQEKPNVFLCVSSFNESAKKFYLECGYEIIGELKNYLVNGYSEILMRKTISPILKFKKQK